MLYVENLSLRGGAGGLLFLDTLKGLLLLSYE